MKQSLHTLNSHTVLLIERGDIDTSVPMRIDQSKQLQRLKFYSRDQNRIGPQYIALPPGNWKSIGLASEVSEEVAAELVEHHIVVTALVDQRGNQVMGVLYRNYISQSNKKTTAVESFHSFLKAHGYKPETTVILLKQ